MRSKSASEFTLNRIASLINESGTPPKTRAEATYRRLRQDILWGILAPGTPLRSDELKRTYDIGISPLRESLTRLASEQLVISSEQKGFRVAPVTSEDVLDTMEARIVVESEALSRSIHSAALEWETEIVSSFHALSRIDLPAGPGEQAETWARYHRQFHLALIAGCNSNWLVSLAKSLYDHAERHRIIALHHTTELRDAGQEHQRILDASLSGNVKAAVAALDHHYRSTADFVVKCLAKQLETEPKP